MNIRFLLHSDFRSLQSKVNRVPLSTASSVDWSWRKYGGMEPPQLGDEVLGVGLLAEGLCWRWAPLHCVGGLSPGNRKVSISVHSFPRGPASILLAHTALA